MSSSQLLPCEAADVAAVAELVYRSKSSLTINRLLIEDWPNETAQRAQGAGAVQSSLNNPDGENLKVVDDDGEILGYVTLSRKRPTEIQHVEKSDQGDEIAGEIKENDASAPEAPKFMNPAVFKAVVSGAQELTKDNLGFDHYEITFIVIRQDSRRRGIGTILMEACFEKARTAKLPITLQSEPQAYPFFTKLGFKDTKHVDWDLSEWAMPNSGFGKFRLSGMIWEP